MLPGSDISLSPLSVPVWVEKAFSQPMDIHCGIAGENICIFISQHKKVPEKADYNFFPSNGST